jgi:hypothetical protein
LRLVTIPVLGERGGISSFGVPRDVIGSGKPFQESPMIRCLSLVALVLCALTSCTLVPTKLPTYDACIAMPKPSELRVARLEAVQSSELSAFIPYALVSTSTGTGSSVVSQFLKTGTDLRADLVCMQSGQSITTGTTVVNFGAIGSGIPWSEREYNACLYRLAPASIGARWDPAGMLVSVSDAGRAAGLLEGDHLISISCTPILYGQGWMQSEHYAKLLALKPGDEVKLSWIRPGTGKLEGIVRCEANPPTHMLLPDAVAEQQIADEAEAKRRAETDY